MGQCLEKVNTLLTDSEPAPHSYCASIRATETGKATNKGYLLFKEQEIIFYENKKPEPLYQWELQYVRKYGVDKHTFSIYAGSRTKTGEGAYIFRCRKAEQLGREFAQRIQAIGESKGKQFTKGPLTSAGGSIAEPPEASTTNIEEDFTPLWNEDPDTNYVNVGNKAPARPAKKAAPPLPMKNVPVQLEGCQYTEVEREVQPGASKSDTVVNSPRPSHSHISVTDDKASSSAYVEIDMKTTLAMADQERIE